MEGKLRIVSDVLRIRRYAAIAAAASAGLAAVYLLLTMSMLPAHAGVMSEGYGWHIAASLALTAAIALLGGINVAMVVFRIRRDRAAGSAGSNTSAFLGGAFSAFTPGCPACTAPLAAVLGAAGGLSIFPMLGLELKLVSVGVLAFSLYWVARGLQRRGCCSI